VKSFEMNGFGSLTRNATLKSAQMRRATTSVPTPVESRNVTPARSTTITSVSLGPSTAEIAPRTSCAVA